MKSAVSRHTSGAAPRRPPRTSPPATHGPPDLPGRPGLAPTSAARMPLDVSTVTTQVVLPPKAVLDSFGTALATQIRPTPPAGFLEDALAFYYSRPGVARPQAHLQVPVDRLLSAPEVRRLLAISPMGLHRLRRSGSLPAVRVGKRRIAFDPADVRAFIDSRKTAARGRRGARG